MAVTRITNNQIEDGTIVGSAKIADNTITGSQLANSLTYGSDLTVSGNLTVSGEVTAIDTINMDVEDPLILLAKEQTGTPALDIGFIGKRGTDTNIAWVWDESDDEFATVFTTDEVTNTNITISSYASFKTLDAAVTGNLAVTGTSSFTSNVSGDLNVDGTVAAGNLSTNGTLDVAGNVDGGNLNSDAGVYATTEVVAGTSMTAGTTIDATGNITGGNLTTAGDVTTATVTASGAITTDTTITATGNITGGNIESLGAFKANSLESDTSITAGTTIDATGNITGANLITAGDIDAATGTILTLDGTTADFSGNVDGGNLNSDADIVAAAAISAGTTIDATGNITGGNLITAGDIDAATGTIATLDGTTADFSGNVDGGNLNSDAAIDAATSISAGTTITATGNVSGGNLTTAGDVTTATVTASGDITSQGDVEGATLTTTGLASVGTLNTTGNATIGGNLHVMGNLTYINIDDLRVEDPLIILGTGPNGAPLTSDDGKDRGAQMDYYSTTNSQQQSAFQGYDNSAGNMVLASNVTVSGDIVTVVDWGQTEVGGLYAHDAITTDSTVTATGNITGGNIVSLGSFTANSLESSTTITAGTSISAGTTIDATGNITGGNLVSNAAVTTVTLDASGAITTDTTIDATGNITGGNLITAGDIDAATGTIGTLDGTTADFSGNVDGGNLNSDAGVYAATEITAGTTITATGNVSGGNLTTAGDVTTATVTASGAISTDTTVDATGNITGGNLVTAGALEANSIDSTTSISAGTTIDATGNITGGNLVTAGAMDSATLSTTGEATMASAIVSDLTDNRVVIVGASGALEDDANFTFDGSTLTVGADAAITGTADVQTALMVGDVAANLTTGATAEFSSTESIKIPVGTTLERPSSPVTGMVRFNTTLDNLEFYDSDSWTTAGTDFTVITANTQTGDGSTVAFTMPQQGTTAGTIVSINGVVQIPTTAYSVSGNVCTFTEAPLSTDSIDFRQLTTTEEVTGLAGSAGQSIQADGANNEWDIAGNLIPTANVTYDLGSDSLRWNDLYLSGSTITLGGIQLKDTGGAIGFFASDGTTPVPVDGDSVDATSIANGTSNMRVVSSAGNIDGNIGGSTVFNLASSGLKVTGSIEATGGFVGLDATKIENGTSNFEVIAVNGNIRGNVGGSTVTLIHSGGMDLTGDMDVSGNLTVSGTVTTIESTTVHINDLALNVANNAATSAAANGGGLKVGPDGSEYASLTWDNANSRWDMDVPLDVNGTVSATGFSGSGASLTALNASNLSSGTVADARISSSSVTQHQANITGTGVLNSGSINTGFGSINIGTSTFTGNGSGLNTLNASELDSGTVPSARVSGSYTGITGTGALNAGSITSGFGSINIGTDSVTLGSIVNANADGVGNIGASGASFNTVHAKATSAQYADLAEMYSADADIEPGTVVMFGGDEEVTTCGDADCKRIAGVVSTNPSYIMNAAHEGDHVVAVALTGRVPTKVVGPVRKGDMMVSAGNGAAKASDDPKLGSVLGKALEDFDGAEGVIEVVVGRM